MKKHPLLWSLLLGSLLGLASGCGQSAAPVVDKPTEIAPLPGAGGVKHINVNTAGPAPIARPESN